MTDHESVELPPGIEVPQGSPATNQSGAVETSAPASVDASTSGLMPMPLTGTIQSLQDGGVRSQSGMTLLHALVGRLEADSLSLRHENAQLRAAIRTTDERYHLEREAVVGLRVQIAAFGQMRWLQAAFLGLGGVIAGAAVPHLADAKIGLPLAGTALGVVLIGLGCVPLRFKGGK